MVQIYTVHRHYHINVTLSLQGYIILYILFFFPQLF